MKIGHELIREQLESLGYEVKDYPDHPNYPGGFVAFKFTVPLGKFRGSEIEVALNATQFPSVPPSGPYLTPHLLPIKGGNVPPYDGIHARMVPTADFQYWSRPFNGWLETDRDMKIYIAFLRTLFDFE